MNKESGMKNKNKNILTDYQKNIINILYELYKLSTNLIERFCFRKEKQILRKKG